MPEKLKKAIAIKPVAMKVIPRPLSGAGMLLYANFSRMAAMQAMAKSQPMPLPKA